MPRVSQPTRTIQPERLEQLAEFCEGLQPILLAGDVETFRRYLRRWEDLVGDTAELAETPEAQTRRTMTAILRRPEQYGLPPWPSAPQDDAADEPGARGAERAQRARPFAVELGGLGRVNPRAPEAEERAVGRPLGSVPQEQPPAEPAIAEHEAIYQLDMLSGELVPLDPNQLGAQPHEPALTARPPRRRRRKLPPNLEQLAFWPAEA